MIAGVFSFFLISVAISYFITSCKDPGHLKQEYQIDHLLRFVNPLDMCPYCKVLKTPRSRHCNICNQCVERFDHHCPWTNNCVGIKNHNSFLAFLTFLSLTMLTYIFALFYAIIMYNLEEDNSASQSCFESKIALINEYEKYSGRAYIVYPVFSMLTLVAFLTLIFVSYLLHHNCKTYSHAVMLEEVEDKLSQDVEGTNILIASQNTL